MITQENFNELYIDPVEQQQIDKFVCDEMSRQMHRYIKAMKGSHQHMLRFEERLRALTLAEREQALARYIDLNRHALDGLDLKIVLTRAMANYCDTFSYFLKLVNDTTRMTYYLDRLKEKYLQFHEIFEVNGKFGMRDHQGNTLASPVYDFLRTPYIYVDDLTTMPVIAQKDGKLGLILPDGKDTVIAPFEYDDIALRDEPPYFEARAGHRTGFLSVEGVFSSR